VRLGFFESYSINSTKEERFFMSNVSKLYRSCVCVFFRFLCKISKQMQFKIGSPKIGRGGTKEIGKILVDEIRNLCNVVSCK